MLAVEAKSATNVIFELETGSYLAIQEDEVWFLVIEDPQKAIGHEVKFLLLWDYAADLSGEVCWNETQSHHAGL